MSLFALLKGWLGEGMGSFAHWMYLDRASYTPLNNITLQMADGSTTQIDHVIVSRYGIFVVEAKNIDGWIFGDPGSAQWTVVKPGRKHRIQNPLRQNYRHVCCLAEFLQLAPSKIHSLVMFWGDCDFKTPLPPNVRRDGYATYIKSFQDILLSDQQVLEICAALKAGAMPKTWATRHSHLASLERRHTSMECRCGGALVLRSSKVGSSAGRTFYGCNRYPKCRYTRPAA